MSTHVPEVESFDVIVVGYGPTGLALAHWLGAAGHRTAVVERWPDLYTLPRAGHVDGEVMRLFQRMGIAERIAADSSTTKHTHILDSRGELMAEVGAEACDQGWAAHYSLFQPNLEIALDREVRASGNVTVLQGWQADSIERDAAGRMRLTLASGVGTNGLWIPTGESRVIEAPWLVGADGANSVVADFLDLTPEDLGYHDRALVIFAERIDPTVGATMPDTEVGMTLPRPYVALRESGKRFARWEFHVDPSESIVEMSTPEMAWGLIGRWGFTPDNSRLVRHSVFEFRTLLHESWRHDNVLLAGDAAHRMPPFQGQGMCSGQRDAAAIAWRLDLVLRGLAEESLLDTYTEERRPHVLALTLNSAERGQKFWIVDPEAAAARDAEMRVGFSSPNIKSSYGSVPGLSVGTLHQGAAGLPIGPAGRLSPQYTVAHQGRRSLLDDHVGTDWLLVTADADVLAGLGPAARDVLDVLGVRTWTIGAEADGGLVDVDGSYAAWLAELGVRAVVVRPDSYVFGAAGDPESLDALLAALGEQLRLRRTTVPA